MTNERSFWTAPRIGQLLGALAILPLIACTLSKSSNVLSPTIAGPIPGVNITAPSPVAPNDAAKVNVDNQPVTLIVNNASTSGQRPLGYHFDVATDASFTNTVFTRDDVAPGDGGRTSLKLPDPLAPDRTYYWRARAQDGANTGPFSPVADFDVIVPVVLGAATLVSPINGVVVDSLHPRFTIGNAPRSGPANQISYVFQVSDSATFANTSSVTVGETPNQTIYDPPIDGQYNTQYFWRVQAQERTTVGPWSATQSFRTPLAPPPPPPPSTSLTPEEWFMALVAGKPFSQETLIALEPALNQAGWKLTPPNAAGDRTKVLPPGGVWTRVGFGEGHWVWLPEP